MPFNEANNPAEGPPSSDDANEATPPPEPMSPDDPPTAATPPVESKPPAKFQHPPLPKPILEMDWDEWATYLNELNWMQKPKEERDERDKLIEWDRQRRERKAKRQAREREKEELEKMNRDILLEKEPEKPKKEPEPPRVWRGAGPIDVPPEIPKPSTPFVFPPPLSMTPAEEKMRYGMPVIDASSWIPKGMPEFAPRHDHPNGPNRAPPIAPNRAPPNPQRLVPTRARQQVSRFSVYATQDIEDTDPKKPSPGSGPRFTLSSPRGTSNSHFNRGQPFGGYFNRGGGNRGSYRGSYHNNNNNNGWRGGGDNNHFGRNQNRAPYNSNRRDLKRPLPQRSGRTRFIGTPEPGQLYYDNPFNDDPNCRVLYPMRDGRVVTIEPIQNDDYVPGILTEVYYGPRLPPAGDPRYGGPTTFQQRARLMLQEANRPNPTTRVPISNSPHPQPKCPISTKENVAKSVAYNPTTPTAPAEEEVVPDRTPVVTPRAVPGSQLFTGSYVRWDVYEPVPRCQSAAQPDVAVRDDLPVKNKSKWWESVVINNNESNVIEEGPRGAGYGVLSPPSSPRKKDADKNRSGQLAICDAWLGRPTSMPAGGRRLDNLLLLGEVSLPVVDETEETPYCLVTMTISPPSPY